MSLLKYNVAATNTELVGQPGKQIAVGPPVNGWGLDPDVQALLPDSGKFIPAGPRLCLDQQDEVIPVLAAPVVTIR